MTTVVLATMEEHKLVLVAVEGQGRSREEEAVMATSTPSGAASPKHDTSHTVQLLLLPVTVASCWQRCLQWARERQQG
jgi:hypothetical protein